MPGLRVTVDQQDQFWEAIRNNASVKTAARIAGFSEATGKRLVRKPANGREYGERRKGKPVPDVPTALDAVCVEAREALEDPTGSLFALRYWGVELSPFQQQVWVELEALWRGEDREYVCLNAPPGLGKSTVLVIFASKRVVMNRAVRVLFMSRAYSLAVRNTRRLRRALERQTPMVGAEATLASDFGRFKPRQGGDTWKADEFVVEQMDGEMIEEKEATVAAFGFDAEWIGNRIDLLLGDDLDTTKTIRNIEVVETNRDIFDGDLEPRLEGPCLTDPFTSETVGGLFVLAQQRLGAFDFSAHVLAKKVMPDDDDGLSDEAPEGRPMYRRLVYRAHYEELCRGADTHRKGVGAYPHGCLLDPRRLPWRDVRKAMNNLTRFKVVYQQEDPGTADSLVQQVWVDGGLGDDGGTYLGCWDKGRDAWELPRRPDGSVALEGQSVGYLSIDPAAGNWWSAQAWVDHPPSEQQFLLDQRRARMKAPDFLEWLHDEQRFSGIAEEWWHQFKRLGVPLQYVIFEQVAAHKYALQYDHVRRWCQLRGVTIVPHDCVDTETEVLSQRGWLHAPDVQIGDQILTLNVDTGFSEWKPVSYVYRGYYVGVMHRYDSRTIDALCTPDHKWPRTDQTLGPIRLVESRDLNTNSVLPLARPMFGDPLPLYADDLVELVGWAVAEGHFRARGTEIAIGQSRRHNPENCERLRLLLKRLGANWNERDNHTGWEVSVFSVTGPVASAVRAITQGAKHLPPGFITGLPSYQREMLLEVLTITDGWKSKSGTRNFCSTTDSLATAYEMLCALEGSATYRTTRPAGTGKLTADHFVVRERQARHAYLQNKSNRPVEVEWEGEIWCPRTTNGTFYARRGGKTYFTGNTHRNKTDKDYGIEMLGPEWKYGRVRLPGKGDGRVHALQLVYEVTRYPHSPTFDCGMAQWFFVHNRKRLSRSAKRRGERGDRLPIDSRRPAWAV